MLPGAEIIEKGLADLDAERETVESLGFNWSSPPQTTGIVVPQNTFPSPEHRLYDLLFKTDPETAYSRYNSLIRRLVSFERAAECGI